MTYIVIVGYRPKSDCEAALADLLETHVQRLREEGLATDRQSIVMQAADGTFVEVFEWVSAEAMRDAHTNAAVQTMWAEYAEVCDYVPIADVPEAQQLFSQFSPV